MQVSPDSSLISFTRQTESTKKKKQNLKEQLSLAEGSNWDAVKAETQRWRHKRLTAKEEIRSPYIPKQKNKKISTLEK